MEKLLLPAIHLFALLGFLFYKMKAPFIDFVRGRRTTIFDGLNKSKTQVQDASRRRAEIERKLSLLDSMKTQILAEWAEKAQHQTKAIKEGSVRIREQMRAEAEQNKKALIESTKKAIETGFRKTVIGQAEEKIIRALNPEVHAKINSSLASKITEGLGL